MEKPSGLRRRRILLGRTLQRVSFDLKEATCYLSLLERGLLWPAPKAARLEKKLLAYLEAEERLARQQDKAVAR